MQTRRKKGWLSSMARKMSKKKYEEIKKQTNLYFAIGGILIVWILALTFSTYRAFQSDVVKESMYSKTEQQILNMVEKKHNQTKCEYYIKSKNEDGTYTVAVTNYDEVHILCYYVVNPTSKTIAYYEN